MTDDLLGKEIGGYLIESRIGRGGMATVYRARQLSMNRDVALKLLPREFVKDDTYMARFEREVRIVAQLEHRNIVPVYDHGELDGLPYIAMRYMSGGSVDELVHDGPVKIEKALDIITQIAPALDYAHHKNVLHRDLKPSNVLLDDDGGAYLTDFGIARMLGIENKGATITTQGVVGTPSYMSPEQAQGHPMDGRSDIYALGVMLFEMATGRRPFHSDTPYSIAVMQVTTPPPSARGINPDLTMTVEQVIYKALKKKPEDRYQTAVNLAESLRMAVERPGDFAHDTEPRPIPVREWMEVTQPTPVQDLTQPTPVQPQSNLPAPPPQSTYPPVQPSSQSNRPVQAVRPARVKSRRRKNNFWLSMLIGVMIGCGLLALVVIVVTLLADNFLNSTSQISTPQPPAIQATGDVVQIPVWITLAAITPTEFILSPTASATMTPTTRGSSSDPLINSHVLYFAEHEGAFEIFRRNMLNRDELQLTSDDSANLYPAISPDGERIVFQSDRDGDFDLYTMNDVGGDLARVFNSDIDEITPSWSPDGDWILFAADTRDDSNHDIFIIRPDGSDLRQLFSNGQRNSHPRWHPSGGQITFVTGSPDDSSTWDVAVLDIGSGRVQKITENDRREAWPVFSTDGSSVIYVFGNEGRNGIGQHMLTGGLNGAEITLYENNEFLWGLNVTPDGRYLAFNASLSDFGEAEIYVIRTGSSIGPRREIVENGFYVSWIPDSS